MTDTQAEKEIHRLEKEFERLLNEGEYERLAAVFYATDAKFLPPNAPAVDGRDAIAGFLRELGEIYTDVELRPGMVVVSGDLAVAEGTYGATLHGPDGATRADRGKFIEVFRKDRGGNWTCFLDTFTSDLGEA